MDKFDVARVLIKLIIAVLVIGGIVYEVWREIAIFNLLSGGA